MKKLYIIILLAFIGVSVGLHPFGANAQPTFCVTIDAVGEDDKGFSIIQSTDGGYVVAGSAFDALGTFTATDAYILKLDSMGILQWKKAFGGSTQTGDWFTSVIQTTDGGYIATGCTNFGAGYYDVYIVKFDNAGTVQWTRTVGGPDDEYGQSIIQTTDGGYAVVGSTETHWGPLVKNVYVVKLDNTGALQWTKTIGNPSGYSSAGYSIIEAYGGGFMLVGYNGGMYAVKLNNTGVMQWNKSIPTIINTSGAWSIVKSYDGGYVLAGDDNSAGGYFVKLDSMGNMKWSKTIDKLLVSAQEGCLIKTKDGGYALAGYDKHNNNFGIIKLDSAFIINWTKIICSHAYPQNKTVASMVQSKDGGYALAGNNSHDVYVIKVDSNGNGCCSYSPYLPVISTVTNTVPTNYFGSMVATVGNAGSGSATAIVGTLSNACLSLSSINTSISCGSTPPCNDTVTVNVSNGHWPYTYSWSNGQTTQTATGLCDGTTYTVTVTDASSATLTTTVIPRAITTTMTITNATSCSSNNGQITASVSGGTAPYNYQWSNSEFTATDISLAPGTYTLTVKDANSCTKTFTATVTCPNGIANYDLQNEFVVYPNPNNGTFTITTQEKEYEIIISNLIGECIYRQIIKSTNQQIDLSEAKSGIYFLNIKTENGIANKKLIINK